MTHQTPQPLNTILFDLDGTLVQHGHVLLPAKLAEWGHPRPLEEVNRAFQEQIQWVYQASAQLRQSEKPDEERWLQLWRELQGRALAQLGIQDPEGELQQRIYHFFAANPVPPLYPDAGPVLRALRAQGWRLGIITQRSRQSALRFLAHHGLHQDFHVVVAGDDGVGRKPRPEPFHAALAQLDSRPEAAAFVGDRVDDDCAGAQAAGLAAAFLIDRYGTHSPNGQASHPGPFVRLTDLRELLDHLPESPYHRPEAQP